MRVIRVKAGSVQTHRPAAVEAPAAVIAPAQGIRALTDVRDVAADGLGEGVEQRADHRVGAAREILGGLGAVAQRLKEQRMTLGVVQAVEAHPEVGEKAGHIAPRRRRLELLRHDEIPVVAELRVALIAEQPPRGRLQRDEILVIGRDREQRIALGERRACIADAELGGREQRCARRHWPASRRSAHSASVNAVGRIELERREPRTQQQRGRRLRTCDAQGARQA